MNDIDGNYYRKVDNFLRNCGTPEESFEAEKKDPIQKLWDEELNRDWSYTLIFIWLTPNLT